MARLRPAALAAAALPFLLGAPLARAAEEGLFTAQGAANSTAALPPSPGFGWGSYFLGVGGLFLILGLLMAGVWALKRYGPKTGLGAFARGDLKLEGQLHLGPKKSVAVVRFLNKRLVLGVTDSSINLLTQTEAGHDDASDFARTLEKESHQDGPR